MSVLIYIIIINLRHCDAFIKEQTKNIVFPKPKICCMAFVLLKKRSKMQHLCVFICLSDFHFVIEFHIHHNPQQSISQSFVKRRQINTRVCVGCVLVFVIERCHIYSQNIIYLRIANKWLPHPSCSQPEFIYILGIA